MSVFFPCIGFFDTFARLKPLDIEIMKRLGTRVNLIPVVAKADTLTQNDLFVFKQRVRGKSSFPFFRSNSISFSIFFTLSFSHSFRFAKSLLLKESGSILLQ